MKSYKPPKAPSYKPPKIVTYKVPKAPKPPKVITPKMTTSKVKVPNASLTKVQQIRKAPTNDKWMSQMNKNNYNQQYSAFGLRRVLSWFKFK